MTPSIKPEIPSVQPLENKKQSDPIQKSPERNPATNTNPNRTYTDNVLISSQVEKASAAGVSSAREASGGSISAAKAEELLNATIKGILGDSKNAFSSQMTNTQSVHSLLDEA